MEIVLKEFKSKTEEAFHDEIRSIRQKSDSDVSLWDFITGFFKHLIERVCDCFCTNRNKND